MLAFLQRHSGTDASGEPGVLVVGPGGGASVLATDACDRHGLRLTPVRADIQDHLRAVGYGAGTSVANPLEIPLGPATGPDAFDLVLEPVLGAQPFSDLLLHVNVQSYYSYGEGGAEPLCALLEQIGRARWPGRAALVLRNLECAPPADASAVMDTAIAAHVPVFRAFDEAAVAIAAGKVYARSR